MAARARAPAGAGAGGAPPALLRLTARAARADYRAPLPDNAGFVRAVSSLLDAHPAAGATLSVRGEVAWGGDAVVAIPHHAEGTDGRRAADGLEASLREADPGCAPLRRNPSALCHLLLDAGGAAHLTDALRLVLDGCRAALAERAKWGGGERARRDRWVSCGLIDRIHAAVAASQGVAPWEADGAQHGPLQPLLGQAFDAIEAYLDIDLPGGAWTHPDKPRRVAMAVIDGEWEGEPPRALRAGADEPRRVGAQEAFAQLLEAAVRH